MTYLQILKKSLRLIKVGAPGPSYWKKTWDEIKWMWQGMSGLLLQIFSFVLWVGILVTGPISLPLLALGAYLYQKKAALKKEEEIKKYVDGLHCNQKSTL